jgi:hypothetical protein
MSALCPVIVAELELGDIEVQVLFADLVETSDAPAFDVRLEALDGLGVDGTNNIPLFAVINGDGGSQSYLASIEATAEAE